MSNSVQPHRWQPTRLPHPWDSPGKNTGVGCHLLLQCMRVKSESEVAQSCPICSDPMDQSPPGSSVHGIFPGKSTGVGCHCLLQGTWLRKKISALVYTVNCLRDEKLMEQQSQIIEAEIKRTHSRRKTLEDSYTVSARQGNSVKPR